MRLLALSKQSLTGKECAELFAKIKDQDLQKKAYSKIVNSPNLNPQERLWFCEQVQDPAEIKQQEAMLKAQDPSISIEERYAAARSIKNPEAQKEAFCCIVASVKGFHYQDLQKLQAALQGLDEAVQDAALYAVVIHENNEVYIREYALELIKNANKKEEALYIKEIYTALRYHDEFLGAAIDMKNPRKQQEALLQAAMKDAQSFNLSRSMDIAKLIHIKELHQQVIQAVWENGCNAYIGWEKSYHTSIADTILKTLEAYNFLSPELKNPALRIELLKTYFSKCEQFNRCADLMMLPCTPSVYKDVFMLTFDSANKAEKLTILLGIAKNIAKDEHSTAGLFEEIRKCASKKLQKEFVYALLKQTLLTYSNPKSLPYTWALEFFMPAASVCDEDIDGLIQNVLSKEPAL